LHDSAYNSQYITEAEKGQSCQTQGVVCTIVNGAGVAGPTGSSGRSSPWAGSDCCELMARFQQAVHSEVSGTSECRPYLVPPEDQRQVDAEQHLIHAHIDDGRAVTVPIHDAGIALEIIGG